MFGKLCSQYNAFAHICTQISLLRWKCNTVKSINRTNISMEIPLDQCTLHWRWKTTFHFGNSKLCVHRDTFVYAWWPILNVVFIFDRFDCILLHHFNLYIFFSHFKHKAIKNTIVNLKKKSVSFFSPNINSAFGKLNIDTSWECSSMEMHVLRKQLACKWFDKIVDLLSSIIAIFQ